jgi:hypothetical protein
LAAMGARHGEIFRHGVDLRKMEETKASTFVEAGQSSVVTQQPLPA